MRAKYLGNGVVDNYKGVSLKPGCEFEVTDAMKTLVLSAPMLFRVLDEEPEASIDRYLADYGTPGEPAFEDMPDEEPAPMKRKPGRPRKDA